MNLVTARATGLRRLAGYGRPGRVENPSRKHGLDFLPASGCLPPDANPGSSPHRRIQPLKRAPSSQPCATGILVLRAVSQSLLSVMMVITLMWGGCISCPQFFMFPGAQKTCCTKSGQCERPTKSAPAKECQRISLELQNATHLLLDLPPAMTSSDLLAPVAAPLALPRSEAPAVEPSPPDLNVLHSTFLI